MNDQEVTSDNTADSGTEVPSIGEILDAIKSSSLKPIRVSVFYQLALFAVALAVALLPIAYLSLIGLTGWAVFYHATEHTDVLSRGGGGALFAYVAPLTVGVIAVLFMIKPLFAQREETPGTMVLGEDEEPDLQAFVGAICRFVGAPEPAEIEINCEVNAAASFRRGWLSLFGQDLKLIVGLPLAAGMDLRSFGGVLAHEFGHFAQGAGMRLTFVIRNVNAWFSRVVYERDQWDHWLESTAKSIDLRLGIALYLAMLFVWLTRRILWVLMWIGHVLSCFALRHMEYDADTWEARFAGADHFSETSGRLQLLGLGQSRALELLRETWKEKRLAENLPDLVAEETDELPGEIVANYERAVGESKTGLFDTHPADSDRIAAAERLDAPGVFQLEAPARVLFRNWDEIGARATRLFYEQAVGDGVSDENILPNQTLKSAGHTAAYQACERYFAGHFSMLRPLFLDQESMTTDSRGGEELIDAIREAREKLSEEARVEVEAFARFLDADARRLQAMQSQALISAGRRSSARIDGKPVVGDAAFAALEDAAASMRESRRALEAFDGAARDRLAAGILLARLQLPASEVESLPGLLAALETLRPVMPPLLQLRDSLAGMNALFGDMREENGEEFIRLLRERAADLAAQVKEVKRRLGDASYPFDHAHGAISIARFMTVEMEQGLDPVFRSASEAEACVDRLLNLYLRIVGSLAVISEKAERAAGA